MAQEIIYKELSYRLNGICFKIHNELGRFCRERQYCDAVEKRLEEAGIPYVREYRILNTGNIADFIINDKIVFEAKAKSVILKEDFYQVQRYLQATKLKLAILVNFRNTYIKPIRIVRIDTDNKDKFLNKTLLL
jgi:GxxExxY protein